VLDVQRDYANLINQCLQLVSKQGFILFSTTLKNFDFTTKTINGDGRDITAKTIPYDFRRSKPHRTFIIKPSLFL
jgi:23S rRNA G2069 N7-methylase RlmK/C1962 C5-methylase RlmI